MRGAFYHGEGIGSSKIHQITRVERFPPATTARAIIIVKYIYNNKRGNSADGMMVCGCAGGKTSHYRIEKSDALIV